jgi:serine/tyrosine/threonine adenylyltransferase
MTIHFPFDNTYARLPDRFYARVEPEAVTAPRLIRLNRDLALHLRLDPDRLSSPDGVELLSGNRVPDAANSIRLRPSQLSATSISSRSRAVPTPLPW